MNRCKGKGGTFFCMLGMAMWLAACSPREQGEPEAMAEPEPAPDPGVEIRSISTKPWLVTGGDVLLELALDPGIGDDEVSVRVNGERDVTGRFRRDARDRLIGLVAGLDEGENFVEAQVSDREDVARLELSNHPISGPVISGPHQTPFVCQTDSFQLVGGSTLGPPRNEDCFVETREDYVYLSSEDGEFKHYPRSLSGSRPDDIAELTTEDGRTVPFLVRVQTGVINRAIYEIAMLHDPRDPRPDPWNRSPHWNDKLVYTHGGGCRGGWHQQGDRTGGVLHEGLLGMGYAVASSSLNVFGQNCNDLLASETHMMVKERFIERFGDPLYTIGTGASGGSYQSHQTADNYPGLFDGIIVAASFPDVTSATLFTLADSRLLYHYFTETAEERFTREEQRAIAGFREWESIPELSRGAARLDPIYSFEKSDELQGGEVSVPRLETQRYHPSIPEGLRATVYDHTVNVYGIDQDSGFAARPLDNVGVQYGLDALNEGLISVDQFIALNRDIGGFDHDARFVAERHEAHAEATRRAIGSGRILHGGAGLADTPVIDYRSYTDDREGGDIHMLVHQFSTRERLRQANGHADNHVMVIGGRWGFTEDEPDLRELFRQMDQWLMAMAADDSEMDKGEKVRQHRPGTLQDACWDNTGAARELIEEEQSYTGSSRCNELYPAYPTPRHVAGAPLANDIVACSLKPVDPSDYEVSLTDEQLQELEAVFPEGVCDWQQGDRFAEGYFGTWRSFGPSPVNRIE